MVCSAVLLVEDNTTFQSRKVFLMSIELPDPAASLDQAGNITAVSSAPRTRVAAKAYVSGGELSYCLIEPRPYGTVTAVKTRSDAAQQVACHTRGHLP
jgi:hypothetical protein